MVRARWLCLGAVCASGLAVSPAEAQFFFDDIFKPKVRAYRLQPPVRRAEPASAAQQRVKRVVNVPTAAALPSAARLADEPRSRPDRIASGAATEPSRTPLFAVVSLEDQHVSVYGRDGLIERSDISSGTAEKPTPTGIFAVIQKERWHESNLYSGAPMPFMQRLTWSGVAMHQGQLPGYPASHGCVRLPGDFAEQWYKMTKLGLRVIISPSDIEPASIAHAHLPVPRYWRSEPQPRAPFQSAALTAAAVAALEEPAVVEYDPQAYAAAEKLKDKADLKRAEQAENEAGDAQEAARAAAKSAAMKVRAAERDAQAARDRLAWFGLTGNRPPPPPRADYGDGLMAAIAANELANTRLGEAQRVDAAAKEAVAAADEAVKRADETTEALKARISEMTRRQEPVSILISRKDARLYVRQALKTVFDVPLAIRDPDLPVGNHVFVASGPAPGERALRWTALSMPIETRAVARARGQRNEGVTPGSIGVAIPAESAAGALDRLELPGEIAERLAELVWTGSSVIITDHGLSHETGVGTDFVIETRH